MSPCFHRTSRRARISALATFRRLCARRRDRRDHRIRGDRSRPSYVDAAMNESVAPERLDEIVAEKLRTLAKRRRPTDLADLAMVLRGHTIDDKRVRALAARKFELVKDTDNRRRIEQNIDDMRREYDAAVAAVAPDAPDYRQAAAAVLPRLPGLLP